MVASHGRINEYESENIFCDSTFVPTNPAAHAVEARCIGNCEALAVGYKLADCHMDWLALACSRDDAMGLDECREGNLLYLFFPVPPIAGKVVLSLWQAGHVFSSRDSICVAIHYGPVNPAPVHWKPRNGLESRLVRSNGLDVYEYFVWWSAIWACSEASEASRVLDVSHPAFADGH